VRYNIGLGKIAGIYVFTGPQFGFAFKNMEWSNFGSGTNFSKENMNTTWNIGAGVRLMKHLEASIGYNFALGKAGKAIFNNFGGETGNSQDLELKYKTNTFQVQVAYMF
jgi:opacity protein-like surface antigen